ncbi:rhodanese-like domain-containing protein [Octadecabacter sp. 1_MG-2023]|uniref:rhodanese-like domain-containing protein n=1 Tax=unclassified Octadecabacter TaxID=196158 RepID=UPI001C08A40F|nr:MULTISPECIES: rhodanese-like domain-containing protein [unclassified Octadecabacter]MBU2992417.1 rhodanese-like domain-containing protein [Octadecabacter sp. B2R22]MDO6734826.1 rhodanese-like domain-containing protein [Octadecabacter sp. 1_MG-2023]
MLRAAIFAVSIVAAVPLAAEPNIMSAPDAFEAVRNDEMILIDIRSPGEWAETGVAEGALALTMHSPEFAGKITSLLNANQGVPVGLICATGGRTEYVVSILAENGFPDVIDVSEGMIGNTRGAGWIERGLPLITSEEAQAAYRLVSLRR